MSRCLSLFLAAVVYCQHPNVSLDLMAGTRGAGEGLCSGSWGYTKIFLGAFYNALLLQCGENPSTVEIGTLFFKSVENYQLTSDLYLNRGVCKYF